MDEMAVVDGKVAFGFGKRVHLGLPGGSAGEARKVGLAFVHGVERNGGEAGADHKKYDAGDRGKRGEQGRSFHGDSVAACGKYAPEKILMIGDAPGDFKAAKGNQALFFPIVPGNEERSWERLFGEALERFFKGTYAGAYEAGLVKEFDASLPEQPHWK